MKERIEKVVECIDDDNGVIYPYPKRCFKVVSEREVLEFEGFNLDKWNNGECHLEFTSDIDLKKYDFKIIATPKDSPYEGKSREELIEIIKQLKLKN